MRTAEWRGPRLRRGLRALAPPFRSPRFWVIQVTIVAMAVVHDVILVSVHSQQLALGLPAPLTSGLLLVPVIYAALSFGVGGAVGTALLATLLAIPHWILLKQQMLATHLWIEVVNFAVLMAVGVVVGQQVDRQQQARRRAEVALAAASLAEARYRALFEDQPAPVIITDVGGVVGELNTAATLLLGPDAVGRPLQDSLGLSAAELVADDSPIVANHASDGERHYIPAATEVAAARSALLQIVLTDCTDEYRRQLDQRAYTRRLLAVQEEERRALAQDLHDDPLQDVMYLARSLDDLSGRDGLPGWLVDDLRHGSEVSRNAATALRKLIHGLRPPVLDDLGLVPALRQLCEDVGRRGSVEVRLAVTGAAPRVPDPVELTAYRIIQESLNNVVRHSEARAARVELSFADELVVTVRDGGRGFVGGGLERRGYGLGLIGMAERAAAVGGRVEVRSDPGRGTTVRATLPVTPAISEGRVRAHWRSATGGASSHPRATPR